MSETKSTLRNIPGKTRVLMVAIFFIIALACFAMYRLFSASAAGPAPQEISGGADIGVTSAIISSNQGESLATGGTALESELVSAQSELVDKQKQDTGTSFIERLELQNNRDMYETAGDHVNAPDRVENGMDPFTNQAAIDRDKRMSWEDRQAAVAAKEQQRTSRQNLAGRSNYNSSGNSTIAGFNEAAFLERELSDLGDADLASSVSDAAKVHDTEFSVSGAGKGGAGQGAGRATAYNGGETYRLGSGGSQKNGDATGYDQYFEKDYSSYVDASISSSQKIFDAVDAKAGGAVDVNLSGFGSKAGATNLGESSGPPRQVAGRQQGSPQNSAPSAMQDLNNPVGYTPVARSTKIMPGDRFYAILDIGVNTDEISPIRGTIIQAGPLNGAVFIGEPARLGSKAVLKLTKLTIGKSSFTVNAVAQDPITNRTAVRDDVNHHTFERYSKLILAAGLEGYADALTRTRTVERSDGSTEVINDGLPDGSDQALYAAGRVGQVLVPKFEKGFDRVPTVTIEAGREIIIMFMDELEIAK